MPTDSGEDTIYVNQAGDYAWNKEIAPDLKDGDMAPDGSGPVKEMKAIEVGNIFKLKTRFTEPFKMTYTDANGKAQPVMMGCYGIGPSRVVGSIVEAHHDDRGIIWPKAVAPFQVHIVSLSAKDETVQERIRTTAEDLYEDLRKEGIEAIWDDRTGVSAGAKFADADLMGMPLRLVISEKTLAESSVEWKARDEADARLVHLDGIMEEVGAFVK